MPLRRRQQLLLLKLHQDRRRHHHHHRQPHHHHYDSCYSPAPTIPPSLLPPELSRYRQLHPRQSNGTGDCRKPTKPCGWSSANCHSLALSGASTCPNGSNLEPSLPPTCRARRLRSAACRRTHKAWREAPPKASRAQRTFSAMLVIVTRGLAVRRMRRRAKLSQDYADPSLVVPQLRWPGSQLNLLACSKGIGPPPPAESAKTMKPTHRHRLRFQRLPLKFQPFVPLFLESMDWTVMATSSSLSIPKLS